MSLLYTPSQSDYVWSLRAPVVFPVQGFYVKSCVPLSVFFILFSVSISCLVPSRFAC